MRWVKRALVLAVGGFVWRKVQERQAQKKGPLRNLPKLRR